MRKPLLCAMGVLAYCLHAEQPVVEWIRTHAVRLDTTETGRGFSDLQPLKKIVGDARIVSLGEATHGTREFFQLKHRILEFLATEMGFTIFAIEANMPEAYRLNDFVLNGNGDPAKLLKGMYFWTWDTQEVLDMILWMRDFNKSGKGRIEFTGFDMQTPDVAAGIVKDYAARRVPDYAAAVSAATELATKSQQQSGMGFGVATAFFPVSAAAGKQVRYSGYIKTEGVSRGWAGLWWRVDGDKQGQILAFDNMQDRGATGTSDWKRYEITLPVAKEAKNINFGALHTGDGTAWFDALKVELDGVEYTDRTTSDLDFESSPPKGFYIGGDGYSVHPDDKVFQSGKQSLQMRFTGNGGSKSGNPKEAVASWKAVAAHLESLRKPGKDQELEWAIQNARVVLQCMQMKANEVTRDQSMADNIKWILDQSPKAKMVVWAHNGHVWTSAASGYSPMGTALRTMFGGQMVTFGFAFFEGSFQAVEQGKVLRNFTVAPAPEGSLDATLAATGLPVFALDLRNAPAWFKEPHKSRNIGAIYNEGNTEMFYANYAPAEAFDVLLFVTKTTAAHRNPAGN